MPRMNRMNRNLSLLALVTICLSLSLPSVAADWPQFRGPGASGVDTSKPLPVEWNVEAGKDVMWRKTVPGLSHASPIVSGDRLYVATAVGASDDQLKVGLYGDIKPIEEQGTYQWRLLALDRATGEILWNTLGHEAQPRVKRHPKASHCNSTPATDGRHVVTIFGSEGLFCFDTDGKLKWKVDLGPMDSGYFKSPSAQWGFASSPVIYKNRVVVLCDVQTNSFLAVFELASGKEVWRTARSDVPTWGCPAVLEGKGRTQIIVNGWHHGGGYDFSSGKELWRLVGGGDIPVPTPIVANDLIYLTSAHGNLRPMRAIRPDASGDISADSPGGTNAAIAWVHPRQGNYMQTPIAVNSRVYGCSDSGVVTCFDGKTGKIHYNERIVGPTQGYTASPVSDGRHLYFPGETGRVIVIPATEKFSIVATNDLGEICMSTPAIADGTLYFRTRGHVVAIGQK